MNHLYIRCINNYWDTCVISRVRIGVLTPLNFLWHQCCTVSTVQQGMNFTVVIVYFTGQVIHHFTYELRVHLRLVRSKSAD